MKQFTSCLNLTVACWVFGTALGVFGCAEQPWVNYNSVTGLAGEGVTELLVCADTTVWVIYQRDCREAPVGRYRPGVGWEVHDSSMGLPDTLDLSQLTLASDGSLWMGVAGVGLAMWDGHWRILTPDDGLISTEVWGIFATAGPDIWVVFEGESSVSRWDGERFVTYGEHDGLAAAPPEEVVESSDETIWIHYGGQPVGIARFSDGSWTVLDTTDGLLRNRVGDLTPDSRGGVWATYASTIVDTADMILNDPVGLNYVKNSNVISFTTESHLASNSVNDVFTSPQGQSWISYEENLGVHRFDDGQWTLFTTRDGLSENSVGSIAVGVDGDVWISHWERTALSRFDGEKWTQATTGALMGSPIYGLAITPGGAVWGTLQVGLGRYEDGKWMLFSSWLGLALNDIRTLQIGPDGTLWLLYGYSYCGDVGVTRSTGGV